MTRLPTGIIFSQRTFTKELLTKREFDTSKPAKTPLPFNLKFLTKDECYYADDPSHFTCLVGKLYFLTHTRTDISFVVQTLSYIIQARGSHHLQALHHLIRYVAGTVS